LIVANRELIIERVRGSPGAGLAPKSVEAGLVNGVPLFLSQLASALARPRLGAARDSPSSAQASAQISETAALHGHDLLRHGYTVAQVVHAYGDVCQIVTELATETQAAISSEDFRNFNRHLDDAIAGAVTAYGRQREDDLFDESTERRGVFAHELRNLLNTAILSFDAIKRGTVGLGGSTGAIHTRSLAGLRALVEGSLAEVRLNAPLLSRISLPEFIEEIEANAAMQAEGYQQTLSVTSNGDVMIDADRQLLASAVSNLLQNAFKYSRPGGHVALATSATPTHVLIEVSDECGGLPPAKAEGLFKPFVWGSSDQSGLGLGLSIALKAVQAHQGELSVRDIPGTGCVFTIRLPRVHGGGHAAS
jgi:signal transduction histidine kinase